jgi:hypothetical protein
MADGFGEATKLFHYFGLLKRGMKAVQHNLTALDRVMAPAIFGLAKDTGCRISTQWRGDYSKPPDSHQRAPILA